MSQTTTNSAVAAAAAKRAWKLQEFVAHGSNVNCLALGHKSGRVLVTGGDDKKVNLWAVGKPNCIMSLCGHTTPIECVRFGHTEELVCAGSQSGALKIWDLEAARLFRTLTGHKAGLTCVDFHPYGDFLASGSTDTNLKLWDIRRKGCIFTYKGHSQCVNSLKFSPDGQWIASGGEEGSVKIWDLRAGKLMTEFQEHSGPIMDVEFHPHEFLLASASKDRTVNFWDLESFALVSTTEKDSGPVRCLTFHPGSECLFSASHDSFRVHLWEPHRNVDTIPIQWGKIKDIAIASTQLIGVAHQMSNVSIYVVDLRRVLPMGTPNRGNGAVMPAGVSEDPVSKTLFKSGTHVRRSFVREKPGEGSMKVSEEATSTSDSKSEEDDSDSNFTTPGGGPRQSRNSVDIADVNSYEDIFRPRKRELNRTPTKGVDPYDPQPFEAPMSGSESETNGPTRPSLLRVRTSTAIASKHSPSPTRRASQPSLQTSSPEPSTRTQNVRMRRISNTSSGPRPTSYYDGGANSPPGSSNAAAGSPTRYSRASSVQPRSAAELDYRNGGDVSPPTSDLAHHRAHSLNRSTTNLNRPDFTPLTPVSRIQIGGSAGQERLPDRPLDRPTLVRPNRSSLQHLPQLASTPSVDSPQPPYYTTDNYIQLQQQHLLQQQQLQIQQQQKQLQELQRQQQQLTSSKSSRALHQPQPAAPPSSSVSGFGTPKSSVPNLIESFGKAPMEEPEKENAKIVPMNSDKPCGLNVDEFLPQKFRGMSMSSPTSDVSRFSGYKGFQSDDGLNEVDATSSILKGHQSMLAVLTTRGRNIEILHKLWQNKDAKAAVDQAVAYNDQAVLVDFLSVITLRPSIWNLDLCTALLPPIGDLLQSKYEYYITSGCAAIKLILKNFATVIKSNIDSPIQTVGVDISREERHNKCMQCYKDLVKIRSLILKRQTMQGKMGHTYRELSILMQYLD